METLLSTNYTTSIKLIRIIEKRLHSVHLDLTLDLELDPTADSDVQVNKLNLMKKWMENVLTGCIAFNVHNPMNTDFLGQMENNIMFCPDEPNDYLLLLLIVAKLNAIGNDIIEVRSAGINSDESQGFGYSLIGDPLEVLISPEDWMGKTRYFEEAWWNRPDGGMMDLPMEEGDDPNKKPDILIDLEPKAVQITTDKIKNDDATGAEIIKLNFKPTVTPND